MKGNKKKQLIEDAGKLWFDKPKRSILAEQIMDLEDRIKLFVNKYKDEKHLLIFGHGSWIRAFISFIQTGSIDDMNQINLLNNEMNAFDFFN